MKYQLLKFRTVSTVEVIRGVKKKRINDAFRSTYTIFVTKGFSRLGYASPTPINRSRKLSQSANFIQNLYTCILHVKRLVIESVVVYELEHRRELGGYMFVMYESLPVGYL